jgi:hypothetical protein
MGYICTAALLLVTADQHSMRMLLNSNCLQAPAEAAALLSSALKHFLQLASLVSRRKVALPGEQMLAELCSKTTWVATNRFSYHWPGPASRCQVR